VRLAQMLTARLGKLRGRHSGVSSAVESRVRLSVIGNPASLCPNTCLAFARHEAGALKINPC
jgi:hypothetical protein